MTSAADFFGWVSLITTLIGLIPQIIKAHQSKSTKDLSHLYLINYLVCSISWVNYGVLTDAHFVVYSNVFGTLMCLFLMLQKRTYDQHLKK
ncbi:MAG: PQ-loop repeat-containing protein [Proteobacteria bacterium]|nr:PQ-loop repeat-containing protein [Pseudomonadota bacterium]